MQDSRETGKKPKPGKIAYVFGVFMIAVYVGMAYLMLFTSMFKASVPAGVRYFMGGLFLVYGVYRAYRQIKNG